MSKMLQFRVKEKSNLIFLTMFFPGLLEHDTGYEYLYIIVVYAYGLLVLVECRTRK
jgi:hypothetical protein